MRRAAECIELRGQVPSAHMVLALATERLGGGFALVGQAFAL